MTRFQISLATPADDRQLRGLLAATPMPGRISLSFAREPSYFAASQVDGDVTQVGVVRDLASGRIVGMGSRAISWRHVNGRPVAVGYLSGLRLIKELRGRAALLARGYRFLRQLHADRQTPYYLTTIADDNHAAVKLLSSGRAGLPLYHELGRFHTLAIPTTRPPANLAPPEPAIILRPARADDRDAISAFLNEYGPMRQFFPAYRASDLFSQFGLLKGLTPEDLLLAYRDSQLVGTLANWNQRPFKQTIVDAYHGWLHRLRPLYNVWAVIGRRPTLPVAGSVLDARQAALLVVRDDEPVVFRKLLDATLNQLATERTSLLLVGLHERDPLLPVLRHYPSREYVSRLYVVYWPDEVPDVQRLNDRVPYLELGGL